jgi:hypothetical protein
LVVDVDPCLALDTARLLESIELQLGAGPEVRGTAAGDGDDTRVLLDCIGVDQVELTIIDPLSDSSSTRTIERPQVRVEERLGWAVAASVRASWMQLVLEPEPALRSTDAAVRRAKRVARRPATAWELGDGFAVRSFFDPRSPNLMLGEQVEALHRPLRHLAWKADGELAYWRVPVLADGSADRVNTLTISVAPALLGWGELRGRGPGGAGTVSLYGGAGFRVGGVRMRSGQSGRSDGFDPFLGALATARVSVALGRFVRLALNGEVGWILQGPVAPNGVPLSFVGPWANGVIVIVSAF